MKMDDVPKGQEICDRTRVYALRIIKVYQFLQNDGVGRVLGKQMLRSGTSIGANVEEAQAGQSKADFVSKMNIALKEARETRYWLNLFMDAGIFSEAKLSAILIETDEIIKILYTIIRNTKQNSQ